MIEFRDRHHGEDVWVVASGASMNHVAPEFFAGRTVVGVNDVYRRFPVTYAVRKHHDGAQAVIDGPPGRVLCELYPHSWVDDEFIQTAKARGVYAHAADSHVEHLHWLWGKAEKDATYELGMKRTREARRIYQRRRRLWR